MKPVSRRKYTANMYAVNEGTHVNIRISGKRHARIGLVTAQCEGALLAPHSYSGTMKASVFEKRFEEEL